MKKMPVQAIVDALNEKIAVFMASFVSTSFIAATAFAVTTMSFVEKDRVSSPNFAVGTGSKVKLQLRKNGVVLDGVFLARIVSVDSPALWMILKDDGTTVYLIDERDLKKVPPNLDSYQKLVSPIPEEVGTCAAFAMYNETMQLKYNGIIKQDFNDEARLGLMAYYMNEYYVDVGIHKLSVPGILNSKGKTLGFNCDRADPFSTPADAFSFIHKKLTAGIPVMVEFNIGPDMDNAPYDIVPFEKHQPAEDPRLWTPRKKGDKNSGGHVIVLASSFMLNGHEKAVVIDSDWTDPRIWDLDKYLNEKTVMKEVILHTCKATSK